MRVSISFIVLISTLVLSFATTDFNPKTISKSAYLSIHATPSAQDWDCQIYGRVTNRRGEPIPGVRVTLEGKGTIITREDGRYFFKGLRPGTYQVSFESPVFGEQRISVTLQGTSFPIRRGERKELNMTLIESPQPKPRPDPTLRPTLTPTPSLTPRPPASPRATPTPSTSTIVQENRNLNGNFGGGNRNTNGNASTNASPETSQSPDINEQINNLLESVKGKIVYTIPKIMRVGENIAIKVEIARGITQDIQDRIAKEKGITVEDLPVADSMEVDLISEKADAFDIKRQQPRAGLPGWQAIGGNQASAWIFDVTPLESGSHNLKLIANVLLTNSRNQNQPYSFKVYEDDITVSSNLYYYTKESIKNYWQLLLAILTTILIPIGALLWNRLRRKGRTSPPDWERV